MATNITQLIDELGAIKDEASSTYKHYKALRDGEEELKSQLTQMLRETGLKSAKNAHYNVSMASKPSVVITNEAEVIEWLKETPNVEADLYIGLKKSMFDPLARTMLKSTGEVAPGTEVQTTEYLSVTKVKAEKKEAKE